MDEELEDIVWHLETLKETVLKYAKDQEKKELVDVWELRFDAMTYQLQDDFNNKEKKV